MPIPIDTPKIEPARTYDALFLRSLQIQAGSTTQGMARLELCPFETATGHVNHSDIERFQVDLWKAAAEAPEVAQAMGAVLAAVPALKAWAKAQQARMIPPPLPGNMTLGNQT